ncbi:MAG: hypothetical protein ACT4PQ_03805, partial [Betaproteobacteria bacterium]
QRGVVSLRQKDTPTIPSRKHKNKKGCFFSPFFHTGHPPSIRTPYIGFVVRQSTTSSGWIKRMGLWLLVVASWCAFEGIADTDWPTLSDCPWLLETHNLFLLWIKNGRANCAAVFLCWLPHPGSNLGPADYNACALDYLITLGMTR